MTSMRSKTKGMGLGPAVPPTKSTTAGGGESSSVDGHLEMRPGGMVVQKRCNSDQNRPPPPTIRVRVKYGSVYHEINISSQASFGELKKMLTGPTGLHHEDQKLIYKDKERDSKEFLDSAGVKNKSKIVVIEDSISQEKRFLQMRKTAKLEKATKSISDISLEVDRLAGQVMALESVISKGGNVEEKYVLNLIDLLMNQLLKLDGVIGDVDSKVQMQREIQERRVQTYVETLDMLKIKNSKPNGNGNGNGNATSMADTITIQDKPSSTFKQQPQQLQRNPYEQVSSPTQQHKDRRSVGVPKQRQKQLQELSRHSNEHVPSSPVLHQEVRHSVVVPMQSQQHLQQPSRHSASPPVVITTNWETFDAFPMHVSNHPSASTTSTSMTKGSTQPVFNWDLL